MTSVAMSAVVLGLAWFAAVNALVSLLVWGGTRFMFRGDARRSPRFLFGVRMLPAAASLVFAVAVFLPAHWRFEPPDVVESFGLAVYALAAAATLLIGRSLWRTCEVARAGRQLRACVAHMPPLSEWSGVDDAYELRGWCGVSLAGIVRTRILIGDAARRALSREELDVAVAHEAAHRRALDNVKRFAMFCAPDLLGRAAAACLEEQWRAAAESEADDRAVGGDPARALDLAAAIVKVARTIGAGPAVRHSPAWSTLHEAALLEARVRHLLTCAPGDRHRARPMRLWAACALGTLVIALSVSAALSVHQLTEALVRWLP